MEFQGKFKADGFDFDKNRDKVLHHCKFHIGERFILSDLIPESRKQRGFFEGAVIPLWIYLDGYNYKDPIKQHQYHEYAKEEFNPEILTIAGKQKKVGASSKGKLNGENGIINKVIDFLEEQYGVDRTTCLNPKDYKNFKNKIFMDGMYEDYLDYLKDMKRVPVIPTLVA